MTSARDFYLPDFTWDNLFKYLSKILYLFLCDFQAKYLSNHVEYPKKTSAVLSTTPLYIVCLFGRIPA